MVAKAFVYSFYEPAIERYLRELREADAAGRGRSNNRNNNRNAVA